MSEIPDEVTASTRGISLQFNILVYQEDAVWIAHCLEMDVPAEGATSDDALTSLIDLMSFQIETALAEADLQSIFSPAPPALWKSYALAKDWPPARQPKPAGKPVDRLQVRELGGCPV